jgi:hemoglobin
MSLSVRVGPDRRAEITAEIRARTGIDEVMIDRLVARVREDELLGPIFASRIKDWEPHLQKMCAFWSSVALLTGVYHGQPMQKHLPLPIDSRHFDRWLKLFAATARDLCPPEAVELFIERSNRIAEALELGLAGANGVLLAKGERFRMVQNERSVRACPCLRKIDVPRRGGNVETQ